MVQMIPGDLLIIPPHFEYGVNHSQFAIYLGLSPGRKEGYVPAHRILAPSGLVLQFFSLEDRSIVNLSEQDRNAV